MTRCRNCRRPIAPHTGHRASIPAPLDSWGRELGPGECLVLGVAMEPVTGCPECGAALSERTSAQLPLLRHGGYGEVAESVGRHCERCGWRQSQTDRRSANPRRT